MIRLNHRQEWALVVGMALFACLCAFSLPWRQIEMEGTPGESIGRAPAFAPPERLVTHPGTRAERPGYSMRPPARNPQVDTPRLAAELLVIALVSGVAMFLLRSRAAEDQLR